MSGRTIDMGYIGLLLRRYFGKQMTPTFSQDQVPGGGATSGAMGKTVSHHAIAISHFCSRP